MSVKRKQLRDAVVAALTGTTDCGSNVFENRRRSLWQGTLPAIIVRTEDPETIEVWAESGPREYQRTLPVQIEIFAQDGLGVDDILDLIGEQVEAVMFLDHTLDELCHDVALTQVRFTKDDDGDTDNAVLVLSYDLIYHTICANSLDDLEYLEDVYVTYDIYGDGGTDPDNASDFVTGLND
jgi:hypothetical protein